MNHRGTQPLETNRLRLRRFCREDAQAMFDGWASDPEVAQYLSWRAHSSLKVTQNVLDSWCAHYTDTTYNWALELKESGELIGSAGMVHIDEGRNCGTLGYTISRKFWGRELVPEAMREILRFAFEEVGMERVEAIFLTENEKSGRVMEKLGMHYVRTIEGEQRDNQGNLRPVREYALTREEFERLTIRPAYRFEIVDVGNLYHDLCETLHGPKDGPGWVKHVYPRTSDAREAFEEDTLYVAVMAGRVVGTVILTVETELSEPYSHANWLYPARRAMLVHKLAVHPTCRGRGVGRQLLAFTERTARERGCQAVRLDTSIYNTGAIRLYENCGYRHAGRIDLGLGEPNGLYWFYTFEKRV